MTDPAYRERIERKRAADDDDLRQPERLAEDAAH